MGERENTPHPPAPFPPRERGEKERRPFTGTHAVTPPYPPLCRALRGFGVQTPTNIRAKVTGGILDR